MKRCVVLLSGIGVLLCVVVPAVGDSFVLDPYSSTLVDMTAAGIPATSADVLNDPTAIPGYPTIGIPYSALGLQPADWIDALSDGYDVIIVQDPQDPRGEAKTPGDPNCIFSVHRPSRGRPGTGVRSEWVADTPTGTSPGHAADLFLSDAATGNILAPAGEGWTAGTTDGDEANAGLQNPSPGHPSDEVCAYDIETLTSAEEQIPAFEVYFSLAAGSPTLTAIGASPGDILAVGGAHGGPTPVIFRTHFDLGIPATADLDALILEVDPSTLTVVRAEYSVTPAVLGFALPSSGDVVDSAADVILWEPGAVTTHSVVHQPVDLGLRDIDSIDALESGAEVEDDCPCDINEDGVCNLSDLAGLLGAFGCTCADPCYVPRADFDGDCCVGLSDLAWYLANCFPPPPCCS